MRGVARAVGYVRVSKVSGRAGRLVPQPGPPARANRGRGAARGPGGRRDARAADQSGGDRGRPRWNEAIRRAEDGEVEAVVVWNLSRFSRKDLDSWLADTKLRGILGPDRYADATADRVAVVNKADMEDARERHGGRYELVARLWLQEWGWAERKEYVSRMIKSVVVSKGREPLSERVAIELR